MPAARLVATLPQDSRRLLADLLDDLGRDAAQRAQRRHKAPMAAC